MHASKETLQAKSSIKGEFENRKDDDSSFSRRHIGPRPEDISDMLQIVSSPSLRSLIEETLPSQILLDEELDLPEALSEDEALKLLRSYADKNSIYRSFIGQGYYNCLVPAVIQRNILENPSWYTQYTPYQAEIAQGRLEALLNFQTMVTDLCGMEIANSSLLDEGTAIAEAMTMIWRLKKLPAQAVFAVHKGLHPQSIEVLATRAEPLGIVLKTVETPQEISSIESLIGLVIQNPSTDGQILNVSEWSEATHAKDALQVVATDLLALCLMESPGLQGADVVVGNSQRFGVPLGFGGPHAAFFATRNEYQREVPGRIIGLSKDSEGNPALRLALQTREQHIKRERATSNICTAQVLLAIMASMYAVYHGPQGLKKIALGVASKTKKLAESCSKLGIKVIHESFFDTIRIKPLENLESIRKRSIEKMINLRYFDDQTLGISLDEVTSDADLSDLLWVLSGSDTNSTSKLDSFKTAIPEGLKRTSEMLTHPVFSTYHSESEMLRYLKRLEGRDLSLTHSMIPLGSCTMKLNATSEMVPLSWPEFSSIHPFVPKEQAEGYLEMCRDLEDYIGEITGLPAVSLQPNAGSQGEYAGLMVIRNYLMAKGESDKRNVCLIPSSAHGTNPASASMAGMKVVVVSCDEQGNVDINDLQTKIDANRETIAALMITYPSTHGVFEEGIIDICKRVHDAGGYVYMDGANLNAQVGLCKAGEFGADVCHLNLHKTFCIPHGGGGPGMGPIAGIEEFRPFLPGHSVVGMKGSGAVSAAPFGSASILLISWMYIRMMGSKGLRYSTEVAILNANYLATRLSSHFDILYKGKNGRIAHECILDLRHYKRSIGIDVSDVAKRLMDYGFHAPTVSFPVAETLMIEPTESESRAEIDRFCEAMIAIRAEIAEIESGKVAPADSMLRHAPHTTGVLLKNDWTRSYTREDAAFPLPWVKDHKFWPSVSRVDNAYGDRNLFCVCAPMEDYE